MAYFAELDENNIVTRVIVVDNKDILDENGQEIEALGIAFCKNLLGENTRWVQTSYNYVFRKNYAGIGYTYDERRDAFIAPKPFPSFILDEGTCRWDPPIPYPGDKETFYHWDEEQENWIKD